MTRLGDGGPARPGRVREMTIRRRDGDEYVLYDRRNADAWLQSDATVKLEGWE